MTTETRPPARAARSQTVFLIAGLVVLAAAALAGFITNKDRFFQSYLVAFLFWLGLSLGALAFLMTHYLTGSRWGLTIRRVTEAASSTLWLMAILFIPLLFNLPGLYEWARPAAVQASAVLQQKSIYLNIPFFIGRTGLYFAVWILYAFTINRLSAKWVTQGDTAARERLKGISAFGLIVYAVTMTFAAIDWKMSLEPFWSSTIYGLITIFGQMLSFLAFAVMVLNLVPSLGLGRNWTFRTTPIPYKDLGTLILTFVLSWAYLAYFQLLIIWAGNIPREVSWYFNRTTGGWLPVGVIVAVLLFILPFAVLITMRVRHNLRLLAILSAVIVAVSWVNVYWEIIPAFHPGQFSFSWLDLAIPIGMGGVWVAAFLAALKRRPALREEEQLALQPAAEAHSEQPAV